MSKKIFCFDLDNTLCTTYRSEYGKSKPKKKLLIKLTSYLKRVILLKFILLDIWVDTMIKFQISEKFG